MQAKRFVASDMRRALNLVREQMGEDAMILSTQRTSKGVEIVATLDELPSPTASPKAQKNPPQPAAQVIEENKPKAHRGFDHISSDLGLASGKTKQELAQEIEVARRRMLAVQQEEQLTLSELAERDNKPNISTRVNQTAPSVKHTANEVEKHTAHEVANTNRDTAEIQRLHDEISYMRSTFESQLSAMAAVQQQHIKNQQEQQQVIPMMVDIKQRLNQLGLTQACNDQVIQSLKSLDDRSMTLDTLWSESLARLARRVSAVDDDIVANGGQFAFLGTTGVGKTTTIAKLAARYVMKHGPEKVALLTTDTFRIAAHDQLCSVAKILNVDINVVDNLSKLPELLGHFKTKSLVLIDTPGMSYSDPLLKRHLSILQQCKTVKSALVLSANSQYQMMQASVHSYRMAKPHFCVMTKLDECASLGDAISLLAANPLALAYITNGQAVPDDLALIKPHQLISKGVALSKKAESLLAQMHPVSS